MDEEKKDNLEEKVEKVENVSENATETKVEETSVEENKTEEVVAEENKEKVEESEEKKDEASDEEKVEEKPDATEENKIEEKSETEEFVPEQLEDEDFEKEKEQAKAEKKAKKLAKKENGITDEENGQVKSKKSSPVKMIVIIVLILASIGVIAAYFVINLNKPENAINDFVIYFNKSEWKSVDETIDWQGFLTLALIDDNAQTEADANETEAVLANYMDYDTKYKTVYDELEEKGYGEIVDLIKAGQNDIETILEAMLSGAQLKVEKIISAEKIEKTESLYKIKTDISVTSGEDKETNTVEIYVAKKDGKYKIVGGYLPTLVYQSFIYYQYISANY